MSKRISFLLASTLVVALYAIPGLAHDPEEHEAESTEPDCAAMDASKLDKNDPVAKAMLQKCQDAMHDDHGEEHSTDDSHHSDDDSSTHADTHIVCVLTGCAWIG